MTLLPAEPARVTIDPRRYSWCPPLVLDSVCYAPGCTEVWQIQRHHIVRRSNTGGPLDYITIGGLVVPNVCMLCRDHHDMVTGLVGGHRAWIRYETGEGWLWYRPTRSGVAAWGGGARSGRILDKLGQEWVAVGPLGPGC